MAARWHTSSWEPIVVERPRLDSLVSDVSTHRLTLVSAGAGYGKSTLLRAWSGQVSSVLHTLSAVDGSPSALTRSLTDVLRTRAPGLVQEPSLASDALTDDAAGATAQASALAVALKRQLNRPIVIMLDEWEAIAGTPGAAMVEGLVRQASEDVRIVLSGRAPPDFRLARMRGQGEVLDIGPTQLAFTVAETHQFAALRLEDFEKGLVTDLHDIVAGWPVGIRLTLELMASAPPEERRSLLERTRQPGGPLFEYLAEEVLDQEEEGDRQFLAALAPVGTFDVALCQALGFDDAQERIERLVRRGVYLESTGGGHLVTPLVAAFLSSQPASDPDGFGFAAAACRYHAANGSWGEALRCAVVSASADLCRSLLQDHGQEALIAGHGRQILDAFGSIPATDRTPELHRLEAESLFLLGDWDAAAEIFASLMSGDERVDPGLAWRSGLIQQLRGDFEAATGMYERAADDGPVADVALTYGWWAAAMWVMGDVDTCRNLTARSLELATASADHRALANAHTAAAMVAAMEGDRHGNDVHYLKALDHAIAANDVVHQIRIRVNRSSRHLEEGSYLESIEEATIALGLAELTGFVAFRALGLLNRGRASLRLGRLDEAVSDFESSRRLWDQLGSRQVAYALNRLGDVHRIRGNWTQARTTYDEARSISLAANDRQGLVPALAGLAQVIVREDADLALSLALEAVAAGPVLGHAGALLAAGWVHLHRCELDEAVSASKRAAQIAGKRRDRAALAEALQLEGQALGRPDLLEEAAGIWSEVGDPLALARVRLALLEMSGGDATEADELAITLQRFGARGPATRARQLADAIMESGRPELEIRTLGAFQVLVRGQAVASTAWQSKKARDLIKLLVARRGRVIHREAVIESLWPGEDPAKTGNRLSVTLTTVRGILDPHKERDPDYFIVADRNTLALRAESAQTDLDAFLSNALEALETHRGGPTEATCAQLKTAEAAYVGDFMEEDPYEEWAVNAREEARQIYLSCARAIAGAAGGRGDHEEAARYHLRILEREPFDEAAHLGLVHSMTASGRHGEALRFYRRYCERMAELGVEAAPFPSS